MATEIKPLVDINARALKLLFRELGAVDAVRFLRQFTTGFGNYTQERRELFDNKTLNDIVNEIEADKSMDH